MVTFTGLQRFLEEVFQCNQFQGARFAWASIKACGEARPDGVLQVDTQKALDWLNACKHENTYVYDGDGQFRWSGKDNPYPASMKGVFLYTYCDKCGLLMEVKNGQR